MDDDDFELWLVTAQHEAGHAVMRWLRGMPATAVTVGPGYGLCEGTGANARSEDVLLVALAGIAVETGYGLSQVDLGQSKSADLDLARQLLAADPLLRLRLPENSQSGEFLQVTCYEVEEALPQWFDRACSELLPYCDLVEYIAQHAVDGYLSATELHSILEQYYQDTENNG